MSKKVTYNENSEIKLSITECNSFEVTNNGVLIGYVVKPLYVEVLKKEAYILKFEMLIKEKYFKHYDTFYRTYWFSKTSTSDTTMMVQMLSKKQANLISNWRCEEQEADVYNKLFSGKSGDKYPSSFTYNCTLGVIVSI